MGMMTLKVLSESEIEKLHKETLRIFREVGFKVTHEETLQKLKNAGALVNEANNLVRIPPEMVNDLLTQASPNMIQTGLNGKILNVGGENRYYTSLIIDPFIVDYNEGVRRPVLEDVRRHTIIGESLDRINTMMRMEYPVSDIAEPDSYYKTMEVFLLNTTKHISVYPTSEENCRDWMDIMEVIADVAELDIEKTPLMSIAMAVTSPLQLHGANDENGYGTILSYSFNRVSNGWNFVTLFSSRNNADGKCRSINTGNYHPTLQTGSSCRLWNWSFYNRYV